MGHCVAASPRSDGNYFALSKVLQQEQEHEQHADERGSEEAQSKVIPASAEARLWTVRALYRVAFGVCIRKQDAGGEADLSGSDA